MFCRECGKDINDKAVVCVHCGVPTVAPKKATSQSGTGTRMLLPVDRSKYAVAAGYLGIVAPFWTFSGFLANSFLTQSFLMNVLILLIVPLGALICGLLGVKDIKNNKDKHGMGRAYFGIIMGALSSVACFYFP